MARGPAPESDSQFPSPGVSELAGFGRAVVLGAALHGGEPFLGNVLASPLRRWRPGGCHSTHAQGGPGRRRRHRQGALAVPLEMARRQGLRHAGGSRRSRLHLGCRAVSTWGYVVVDPQPARRKSGRAGKWASPSTRACIWTATVSARPAPCCATARSTPAPVGEIYCALDLKGP